MNSVAATNWSGDGRLVSARAVTGEVRILDAATGADVSGPFPGVANLTFSPTGDTALTVGSELRIIDARSGKALRTFDGIGGLYAAAFVRDGRWISAMTGSGLFELIDIESGTRVGVPLRVARDAVSEANHGVIVPNGIYWGPPDGPVRVLRLRPGLLGEDCLRSRRAQPHPVGVGPLPRFTRRVPGDVCPVSGGLVDDPPRLPTFRRRIPGRGRAHRGGAPAREAPAARASDRSPRARA